MVWYMLMYSTAQYCKYPSTVCKSQAYESWKDINFENVEIVLLEMLSMRTTAFRAQNNDGA